MITKASELFSKDSRFYPADSAGDEPDSSLLFAPFPADAIEEEEYAVLEEQDGILADWRISVGGGRLRFRPRWLI
jgi:hypothetical protein